MTHAPTVEVFRRWDQKEGAYIQLLRFIRISSADPSVAQVSRPGKHFTITRTEAVDDDKLEDDMVVDGDTIAPHSTV